MNKKERADLIVNKLEELYPKTPIPLNHLNNFTLLIAVLLSAQSRDSKVNEITEELFKVAPNPHSMYRLGEKRIYSYIQSIGLSKQKAKYLKGLSQKLINNFNGKS